MKIINFLLNRNGSELTDKEINKCEAFYYKHYKGEVSRGLFADIKTGNGTEVLVAICKNIITNEGTFQP